jgi:hypothetical protein
MKALLIFISFLFSGTAVGNDHMPAGNFGWFGVGNATQISETKIYWAGEFSGTFFSDDESHSLHIASVRCPASMELDLANNVQKAGGYCMYRDVDGNKASIEWSGTGTIGDMRGDWTWVSGDGPYADLVGQSGGTFRGVTITNWEDGMATGVAYWNK